MRKPIRVEPRDFDWSEAAQLKVSARLLVQAEQLLLSYLQSLLGRPLKSLAFIQQL